MSPYPPSPSDALADVAWALHALETTPQPDEGTLSRWLMAFNSAASNVATDFAKLSPAELFAEDEVARVLANWPPATPTDEDAFVDLMICLSALDAWHAPLALGSAAALGDDAGHYDDALFRLTRHQSLAKGPAGTVIPAGSRRIGPDPDLRRNALRAAHPGADWSFAPGVTGRPCLLLQALENTVYVPPTLAAMRSGAAPSASVVSPIGVRYVRPPAADGRTAPSAPLRIGVAPIAEDLDDVAIDIRSRPGKYSIRPKTLTDRIATVVRKALESDVALLFMPETVVPDSDLAEVSETIRRESLALGRARLAAGDGPPAPALRYVFVGAAGEGRNFAVVFDGLGEEVMRQDKLHRWDLTANKSERFNLPAIPFEEDIGAAGAITILDLPSVGRVFTLICADANEGAPGDWLLANTRLDFVHIPIMDGSTCWANLPPPKPRTLWIAERAHRGAIGSGARVLVTNSMTLTQRTNVAYKENPRYHSPPPPAKRRELFASCGVALLVDGRGAEPRYAQQFALIAERDVLKVVDWSDDWPVFDMDAVLPPP